MRKVFPQRDKIYRFSVFDQTFPRTTVAIFIQGQIHTQHQSSVFEDYLIIQ